MVDSDSWGDFDLMSGDTVWNMVSIIDGTGLKPPYIASVIVRGDRIARIELDKDMKDYENIPGVDFIDGESGRWALSPGFIDMHAHSDLALLHTPDHLAKLSQGVTTEVIGQDGIGYSPIDDAHLEKVREQIAGWNGNPSEPNFFCWRSVSEFLDHLDVSKIATNVIYLVPHGNLRILAMSYEEREPTASEMGVMCTELSKSLDQGAFGLSLGLQYPPGMFARKDELSELFQVVNEKDAFVCPHHRSYGKNALDSYREMIDLAKLNDCKLHLTHATLNYQHNIDKADELLSIFDDAIRSGLRLSFDSYPYTPSATTLASTLPGWAQAGNSRELLLDEKVSPRVKHEVAEIGTLGCHGCVPDWHKFEISGVKNVSANGHMIGKTISQIGIELGIAPIDAYVRILLDDDFGAIAIQHVGHEGNVRTLMRHSAHTGGSDGILAGQRPHPRGWGTFPRYIGHYWRELSKETSPGSRIFEGGLIEAVAHLTGRPAKILGIDGNRGQIKEGFFADLCLFDPETIIDLATFSNPFQTAQGIRCVMVNGVMAYENGKTTGIRSGRTIRARQ